MTEKETAMKKLIALMITVCSVCFAENGEAPTTIIDYTDGSVTYIGTALTKASDTDVLPSASSAMWNIVKVVNDEQGRATGVYVAVTANRGDISMRKSVWADRASTNTIYKTVE
jgi:hypothetical protein